MPANDTEHLRIRLKTVRSSNAQKSSKAVATHQRHTQHNTAHKMYALVGFNFSLCVSLYVCVFV